MTLRPLLRTAAGSPARPAAVLVALLLAAVSPRVYAQVRIGVLDIRRAVAETNEGRAVTSALKARFDQRQADLNGRTKQIEALKRQIEGPAGRANPARQQKLAKQYYARVNELQTLGQQYTEELQQIEGQATKAILVRMQPVVREIGQSDNYQLIVDEQVVHFAPSHLNLTDRVVQMYNQRYPVGDGGVQLPGIDGGVVAAGAGGGAAGAGAGGDGGVAVRAEAGAGGGAAVQQPVAGGADAGRAGGGLPSVFRPRDAGR